MFSILFRIFLATSLLSSSWSHAGPPPNFGSGLGLSVKADGKITEISRSAFSRHSMANDKLHAAGVRDIRMISEKGKDYLVMVNSAGAEVLKVSFDRASKAALEKYKPSKWQSLLESHSVGSRLARFHLARVPMDIASFFITIGAVTFYNLMMTYHRNPVAFEQFFESQLDPFSQFSFYLFMVASGLSHSALDQIIKTKSLHHFIPYFGMSAGMLASHAANDAFKVQGVRECVTARLKNDSNKDQLCDLAYTEYIKSWSDPESRSEKWHELKYAAMNLFVTMWVAGGMQAMSFAVVGSTLRFIGFNVALNFVPGTTGLRIANFMVRNVIQIGFFNVASSWIEEPFHSAYNNIGSGWNIAGYSQCVGTHFSAMNNPNEQQKRSNEKLLRSTCKEGFQKNYKGLIEAMSKFRNENLTPVINAQKAWELYLSELATRYRLSLRFYSNLLEVLKAKQSAPAALSPIDMSMPLFGVRPATNTEFTWSFFLMNDLGPLMDLQRKNVKTVSDSLTKQLAVLSLPYSDLEIRFLRELNTHLASSEDSQIAAGLDLLHEAVLPIISGQKSVNKSKFYFSQGFGQFLVLIYKTLGQPLPRREVGQGYLTAWDLYQDESAKSDEAEANIKPPSQFPSSIKETSTDLNSEYLAASFVLGPEISTNESTILVNTQGFKSNFSPPRLVPNTRVHFLSSTKAQANSGAFVSLNKNSIYNKRIWLESDPTPGCNANKIECYRPIMDWIRTGQIREDLHSDGEFAGNFTKWWDTNVLPNYLSAWRDFEVKYEKVIGEFLSAFYGDDRYVSVLGINLFRSFKNSQHLLNQSEAKNGVLDNLNQERIIAMMILSRLLDPSFKNSDKFASAGNSIFAQAREQGSKLGELFQTYDKQWNEAVQLFLLMKIPKKLVTAPLAPGSSATGTVSPGSSETQDGVDSKFESRLPNQSLVKRYEALTKFLDDVESKIKALETAGKSGDKAMIPVAMLALKSLRTSHEELLDYGLVVNSVSYIETHEDRNSPVLRRCLRTRQHSNPNFMVGNADQRSLPKCP